MSRRSGDFLGSLSVDRRRLVAAACARFEDDWRAGRRPAIEDELAGLARADREAVLHELIALEVELRTGEGETPTLREYSHRFPDDTPIVEAAFASLATIPTDGTPNDGAESGLSSDGTEPAEPASDTLGGTTVDGGGSGRGGVTWDGSEGRYRLVRVLGQGSFGTVYLARDTVLGRDVAIKVPTARTPATPVRPDAPLAEDCLAAPLTHPAIVRVYDVGRASDGSVFVVLEYVEGSTFADLLKTAPLESGHLAGLIAGIAEAVHHAHKAGLVHRDLKPSNVLIDKEGRPRVADFGLAVTEALQLDRAGEVAGTPSYMAPEQVRGEVHRLDGRTDVWALGVMLYEGLTGRFPFASRNRRVLFDEILHRDPKHPRQIVEGASKVLSGICLKCLAKRMTDRYPSAGDLAEDLRDWLTSVGGNPHKDPAGGTKAPPSDDQDLLPARVVPKGLRAFDAHDAEFFLDLLPGPRDRRGLPESLRFWKALIESTGPRRAFPVGLIYGPSGSGKSSLVRAGLLPRLGPRVRWVYTEATPEGTEARLLSVLRHAFPGAAAGADLVATLGELREGGLVPPGGKVLIVLDQFEQWLHGRHEGRGTDAEMVAALRQCDGDRVQAIVLIRDDFWMAATRFLRDLEVRAVEGENMAAVDLFDVPHACHVLTLFGRSFGVLPGGDGEPTPEQAAFLEQSIAGLARDGRVIPVRLALFAQMVKDKPWVPATLRAVGGAQGVGLTFLEETFCSPNARVRLRDHQDAARAVLRALLPESGSDIKGRMQPESKLREVSKSEGRDEDFNDLLLALDGELRLITPTDHEGAVTGGSGVSPPGERYYQLTHDYLVPSLRAWLNRKLQENARGRAELRLAEHAGLWDSRPLNRLLPSFWEWSNIVLLTTWQEWTPVQRRMMRRAGRFHGLRVLVLAVTVAAVLVAGLTVRRRVIESRQSERASSLVQQVLRAGTPRIPEIIASMRGFRHWTDPRLKAHLADPGLDPDGRLRVSLALLPVDAGQAGYLADRLPTAAPDEVLVLRDALTPAGPRLAPGLWERLRSARPDAPDVLALAGALARFDPDGPGWGAVGDKVASALVGGNPVFLGTWIEALRPVRGPLKGPLASLFRDRTRPAGERAVAADALATYAADDPGLLADLILDAGAKEFATLLPVVSAREGPSARVWEAELERPPVASNPGAAADSESDRDHQAGRKANAAIALLRVGRPAAVWPLFRQSPDPRVRGFLINRVQPYGVDPAVIAAELDRRITAGRAAAAHPAVREEVLFDPAASELRALVLTLGTYAPDALPPARRRELTDRLLGLHESDPDAGVHGAAEWTLRRWDEHERLGRQVVEARGADRGGRHWFVNGHGQTFAVIGDRFDFPMGSPRGEPGRWPHERLHRRVLRRRFAIAATEVTVEQYARFLKDRRRPEGEAMREIPPDPGGPRNGLTWFEAAEYCNWLSRQDGLPEVYAPNKDGAYDEGMTIPSDALERTGYRLPTDAEWEYACRAGARTSRAFGNAHELLGRYAWYNDNAGGRPHPCGALLPNDLGLFDTYGNAYEWCQDQALDYHPGADDTLVDELLATEVVRNDHNRLLRGGSFFDRPEDCRSAQRDRETPGNSYMTYGFRLARTLR